MSLNFIVGAEPLTKEQESEFRAYVAKNRGTWWHWISNMWLLSFPDDITIDGYRIWEILANINPAARIFVTPVEGDNWVVSDIQNKSGHGMHTWLERNWSKREDL